MDPLLQSAPHLNAHAHSRSFVDKAAERPPHRPSHQHPPLSLASQGRLGSLVHQKSATAVALTATKSEDNAAMDKIVETVNAKFADNADARKKWGGGIMGLKTQKAIEKREKLVAAEQAKKALL